MFCMSRLKCRSLRRRPLAGALAVSAFAGLAGLLCAVPRTAHAQLTFTYDTVASPNSIGYPPYTFLKGVSASGTLAGWVGYAPTAVDTDPSNIYDAYGLIVKNGVETRYDLTTLSNAPAGATGTNFFSINDNGYVVTALVQPNDGYPVVEGIYNTNTNTFITPSVAGATATTFDNVNENNLVATNYQLADGTFHSAIYDINTGNFTAVNDVAGYTQTSIQTVAANGDILANVVRDDGTVRGVLINAITGADTFYDVPSSISDSVIETHTDAINGNLITGRYVDAYGSHGMVIDTSTNTYYSLDAPGTDPGNTYTYYGNSSDTMAGFTNNNSDGFPNGVVVHIHSQSAAAPEPSAALLMLPGGGIGGLLALARRRRRSEKKV